MKKTNIFIKAGNFFRRPEVVLIGLLAIFEIVHIGVLFGNGDLLAGGDNYPYLQLGREDIRPYTWDSSLSLGGKNFAIPNILGLPFYSYLLSFLSGPILQRILIFALYLLKYIAFIKLAKLLSKKLSLFALLPAILLFVFNAFESLNPFSFYYLMYGVYLPFSLYYFIKLLESENLDFLDISKLVILSVIFSPLNSNLALSITIFIPQFLYLILSVRHLTKARIFNVSIYYGSLIISSLWWFIPLLSYFFETAGGIFSGEWFSAIDSGTLYLNFRFLGQWGWYVRYFLYPYYPYSAYYDYPLVILSTYLIIILAFLGGLKNKVTKTKFRLFLLLLALFSLFLIKGSRSPFGFLYGFLYNYVLAFRTFREPFTKFGELYVLSISLLFYFFLLSLEKYLTGRKKILAFLLILSLVGVSIKPALLGEHVWSKWNGSMRTFRIKIPSYWEDFENYVKDNIKNSRILTIPKVNYGAAWNWPNGFSSADDVAVNFVHNDNSILRNPLSLGSKSGEAIDRVFKEVSLPEKYLSLLGVSYILQENDLDWRYSGQSTFSPAQSNRFVENAGLEKVKDFGKFTPDYLATIPNAEPRRSVRDSLYEEITNQPALILYKMDERNFLPYFYIPQKIIYAKGGIESLIDVTNFEDWQIRSGIYFEEIEELEDLKNRMDEILIQPKLEEGIEDYEEYLEKKEEFKSKTPFPYASHKPGSFFYSLVLIKERLEEWGVRKNKEELLEKKLFFAGKRISELRKYNVEVVDEVLIDQTLKLYLAKMEEGIALVSNLTVENAQDEKIKENMVIELEAYWEVHQESLEEIIDYIYQERKKEKILELINNVFAQLNEKIEPFEKKFDWRDLEYTFNIPREGKYELDIQAPMENNYKKWQVELDGEEVSLEETKASREGWVTLGERNFKEGEHKLILHFLEQENLVGNNWQKIGEIDIKDKNLQFFSQGFSPDAQSLVFQKINEWSPNNLYYLGFDYKVEEGNWMFGGLEEKSLYREEEKVTRKEKLFEKTLRGLTAKELGGWKKYETVVRADSGTLGAGVYFYVLPSSSQLAKIDLRNLVVVRPVQPKIILRSTSSRTLFSAQETPKITFIKINPTKYKIKVEGAGGAYPLVFSESFNKGWKAYITSHQPPITNHQYGETVASYFDGEIEEGTHRDIFLDRNTFETWGKKPIPEERHLLVNGYANSWYITPEDSEGREDYEIIIEFWPQRLFYIGLFVSLITFLGCFGYLGVKTIRRYSEKTIFI